ILIDGLDAKAGRIGWSRDLYLPTLHVDVPRVTRVDARDDLDEGGLAGAIVSHEADHLTGPYLEVYLSKGLDGTEGLANAGQMQDRSFAAPLRGDRPPGVEGCGRVALSHK